MVTVVVGVNGVNAVGNSVGGMRVTVFCISIVGVGLVPNPEQPDDNKITIKRINTIFFQYIWLLPYEVPHNCLNKTLETWHAICFKRSVNYEISVAILWTSGSGRTVNDGIGKIPARDYCTNEILYDSYQNHGAIQCRLRQGSIKHFSVGYTNFSFFWCSATISLRKERAWQNTSSPPARCGFVPVLE